jgi:hypothetical protein
MHPHSLLEVQTLSLSFIEGSFEGTPILIKKSLGGRVTIWLSETDKMIGELDYVNPTPVMLKMVNGSQYSITAPSSSGKFILSDMVGRTIVETVLNNEKSSAISAQIKIKSVNGDDLNPWLAAVIALYVAIANSYSNP